MRDIRAGQIRTLLLVGAATALAVMVAACDGGTTADPGQNQVFGYDDAYNEAVIEIGPGDEVEWLMVGDNPHNVFAADGSWQSDLTMERGDRFRRTFDEPGVYPYFCTFHGDAEGGGMAGYVIVGDVPAYEQLASEESPAVADWSGNTIAVPADFPTIQEAVDAAEVADLITIEPGIYHEAVTVRTPSLIIRGADRNSTIVDGEFELSNGFHVVADGVAIENITARNYQVNGFYWTGVTGYRGSYLTAHNNGDYGIYAFDSVDGLFNEVYASGNRDSGIYIGQCYPCNAVVTDSVSAENGLAYSGTNAGGELYLINSTYENNMGGMAPNSLDSELYPPHREVYIGGNLVINNNNADTPTKGLARLAWGEGIVLAGGEGDLVEKNLVVNHDRIGIVTNVLPDKNIWWASDNIVRDNTIAGTGIADLGLVGPLSKGNCFDGNLMAGWAVPPLVGLYHTCDGIDMPFQFDLGTLFFLMGAQADGKANTPRGSDYRTWPAPDAQATMPGAATAVPKPAFDVFVKPDLTEITTPDLPEGVEIRGKEIVVSGVPVTEPTIWTFILTLWGYFLPLALVGAWIGLAIWDMVRREDDMSRGAVVGWFTAILLIPILGVILYFIFGKSTIPAWLRGVVVGGGTAAYLIVLVAMLLVSGAV
ncbi:MAG: PLDc N-terminal domain-containing protein [Acidimicrobiia bacterium]